MRQLRYMADTYEGTTQVDVAAYFKAGRSIIGIKASEGEHHVDTLHAHRSRWAHGEGGTVLHYHFARPDLGTSAGAEAAQFVRVVKPLWKPGDYVCLDSERGNPHSGVIDPAWATDFCKHVHDWLGATPVVYASESVLNGSLRHLDIPGNRYWVAKYGDGDPSLPRGKRQWAWQFTDGAEGKQPHTAPGIGPCDQSLLPLWVALPLAARTGRRRWALTHKA